MRPLAAPGGEAPDQGAEQIAAIEPLADESPYGYASRLLKTHLAAKAPDFTARLRQMKQARGSLKVLSICSGAARIEAGLAAAVPEGIAWALLDINEQLLQMAARQFPATTPWT
ncbi:MAG: hypothetical protein R3E68_00480 [Burkholderiaceae bacterium]